MNTPRWRRTIPIIALLVLLNVMLGICACLGDTVSLPGSERGAVLSTSQTNQQDSRECGDDCDSCVCCASLVVTQQVRIETVLTINSKASLAAASVPSDPTPDALKRPPRA